MKKYREVFSCAVDKKHRDIYFTERAKTELYRAKFIAVLLSAIEAVMIAISLIKYGRDIVQPMQAYYFYMYILLFASMVAFYFLFLYFDKKEIHGHRVISITSIAFFSFILLWNVAITLLDQLRYNEITAYLVAMISVAFLSASELWVTLLSYTIAHAAFLILLPYFQSSAEVIYGHYVNSTILAVMSAVATCFINSSRASEFHHRIAIQEKNDELRRLYEKLKIANGELMIMAQTDGLTGIYNRAMFDKLYNTKWEEAERELSSISVMMIDVDYFKSYNDRYGHVAGDECLKKIAGVLAEYTNLDYLSGDPQCFSARAGGEEFIVVMCGISEREAMLRAEQIRSGVEELLIPHESSEAANCVTISLGVYTNIPSGYMSASDFIRNADSALYEAKNSRNTVRAFRSGIQHLA